MKIYIANTFIESVKKLEKEEIKLIELALEKFRLSRFRPSLNEEKLSNGFKSARANKELRIIFIELDDDIILSYADHHDLAYIWSDQTKLVKSFAGYMYFENTKINLADIEVTRENISLFEKLNINKQDLQVILSNQPFTEILYRADSFDKLYNLLEYLKLPEEVKTAVISLAKGKKLLDILEESKNNSESISSSRFKQVDDLKEIYNFFGDDFESWQLFLHPNQQYLVELDVSGPMLVEGGPGTGKTVVGIHRALYLASNVYKKDEEKVLLITFSKKLALITQKRLNSLAVLKNVKTSNITVDFIGSIIRDILDNHGIDYSGYDDNAFNSELTYRINDFSGEKVISFVSYVKEYEQIIQPNRINSLEEYLKVSRTGMAEEYDAEKRAKIWPLMAYFIENKVRKGLLNHEDVAIILDEAVDKGLVKPLFHSIIVDEAQDLSPIKLKLLKKLLITSSNNLMLLSDREQRVYKINNYKSAADIEVEGRTYFLTLNYRTSKAIYNYAAKELEKTNREKYAKEHESLYWGLEPIYRDYNSEEEQINKVFEVVKELIQIDNFGDFEICIVANTKKKLEKADAILKSREFKTTLLTEKVFPTKESGVCLSTSVGVKGLEFRAIIYLDYNQDMISALPVEGLNERVRYVACTRARERLFVLNVVSI
jgi:superfamily I DNA/RNA helicase